MTVHPKAGSRPLIAILPTLWLTLTACSDPGTPSLQADTLYVGEHVITMDEAYPDAGAVAVRGERIIWVGRHDEWTGTAASTVELGERALLPGFIDAHGHLSFFARTVNLANVASPPVGAVTDLASLGDELRAHIEARDIEPGEWVLGMGYDDSLLAEGRHPTAEDLDRIATDRPIALIHVSGHLVTTNSTALARVGITADSADPPGGVIRRNAAGEPDGVLEETATAPLQPFFIAGDSLAAVDVAKALETYAGYGMTTVQDGAASWPIYRALAGIAQSDGLDLDVVVYPQGMSPDFEVPGDVAIGEYRRQLKVGGVKLILDGSPQGKTAYLSTPYHVTPHGTSADYRGYPTVEQATVDTLMARFLKAGVPVLAHCNGDAAADMLIKAVAAAGRSAADDHRTVMIHAQTVREDQMDRMQALGILPSYFSAHTFYWGDWHRDSVLGAERASRISPTASALGRGMRFTVHNDAPIVPPDMLRLLWATTNRETRSGAVLGEDQRIPTLAALRAMTIHAAYQHFEEDLKGSLTPGKQADLVVLSADPLSLPPERLLELEVVQTVSRGRVVYDQSRGTKL